MNWNWTWTWGPLGSPAQTSYFWDNPPFDVLRLLLVVLAVSLTWYSFRTLKEQSRREEKMSIWQQMRFVSLSIFAISIAATECWLFGTQGTPRLFVNMFAIIAGLLGVRGKRLQQKTETIQDLT